MKYHPNPKLIKTDVSKLKDEQGNFILIDLLNQLQFANEAFTEYRWNKPDSNIIAKKITFAYKNDNWIIASGIYVDDIENQIRALTNKIYIYSTVIFLIGILITFVLVIFITRTIKHAQEVFHNIQQGNYNIRYQKVSNDEIGLLYQSLYQVIENISKIFDKIIPVSIKLEETIQNLNTISNVFQNSMEIQHKNFSQISASTEETSVTIDEISRLIQQTNKESTDSMQLCNNTLSISDKTNQLLENTNQIFINLKQHFMDIQKSSKEIEEILNIIREISNQTNLIALNASIEAAKSGERGSRFSVIAEEIRKLSMNSRDSILQISNTIQKIIIRINEFTEQIQNFESDFSITKENINKLNEVLKTVIHSFQKINLSINQFASATEELNVASRDIAKNIEMNLLESEKVLQQSNQIVDLNGQLTEIIESLRMATMGIKTKSYNRFIFDIAKTDHLVWVEYIVQFLKNKKNLKENELANHYQCRFGKWYYSSDSNEFKNYEVFKQIEEPHKKIHEIGSEIVKLKNQGKSKEAWEKFEELKQISEIIQKHLLSLKQIKIE